MGKMLESQTKIVHIQIFNQLSQVGVEDVGEEGVEHLLCIDTYSILHNPHHPVSPATIT